MLQPRNTVVVLDIIEQAERKVGGIVVPTNGDLYAEAEIVAVGPGSGTIAGGHTETHDLKVGQRVFLQHKRQGRGPAGHTVLEIAGVRYVHNGKNYYLYEQTSILGIVAQPGEFQQVEAKPEPAKSSIIHN